MHLRKNLNTFSARSTFAVVSLLVGLIAFNGTACASDHVDLPQDAPGGSVIERPDARITDFWVFVTAHKLVMVLGLNPFLSADVMHYEFPTDVTYRFNIDNNSAVTIDNSVISQEFGGIIAYPGSIQEDVVFEVTFNGSTNPTLTVTGASSQDVRVFAGLRAEGFIFAPFVRNNIAGIVLETPLDNVIADQNELLLWATAAVDTPSGTFTDHGGRALRSQFDPYLDLNALHPGQHVANGFDPADVVVIDTQKVSAFPNGRALADDVVSIAADFVSLPTDPVALGLEYDLCASGGAFAPCPVPASATADDVRIKANFPYLGAPYGQGLQP